MTSREYIIIVIERLKRELRSFFKIPHNYKIGEFNILLSPDHNLPKYQALLPFYDKFLPHLAKYLAAGDLVIDVGANCGDTLAAMVSANAKLRFLCIEPDHEFSNYLSENIERIRQRHPDSFIDRVNAFAAAAVKGGKLVGSKGTKTIIPDSQEGDVPKVRLDSLSILCAPPGPRLLKTDVDGFDYDVIDSAAALIQLFHPIIFAECLIDHAYQYAEFERVITQLKQEGYCRWICFDNFGVPLLQTEDVNDVFQILRLVWDQTHGVKPRKMYYIDLLTCCHADDKLVSTSVSAFAPEHNWRLNRRPAEID